jgi:uncharacterized protein
LKILKITSLELAVLTIGGSMYLRNKSLGWFELASVPLALPNLPEAFSGFRLAQISDLHVGGWMTVPRLEEVIKVITAQKPDLVTITGDFVLADDYVSTTALHMNAMESALATLAQDFPTLAVFGNHDHQYGSSAVLQMLRRAGVKCLVNQVHTVQRGAARLHLAGLDDVREGEPRLDKVLAQLPEQDCAILLVHEPDYADVSAETGRFDLQISGHSHGGQVVLPFIGSPVLPRMGRVYPRGLYRVGAMHQYTNRGIGMTPPNIRINCLPEITMFTLESAKKNKS